VLLMLQRAARRLLKLKVQLHTMLCFNTPCYSGKAQDYRQCSAARFGRPIELGLAERPPPTAPPQISAAATRYTPCRR